MQYELFFAGRPASRKLNRARRATTLIEMMVVVTLVSILLSVIGTLAIRLRQLDRQVRDRIQHGNQLALLAATIRGDVRQATSVTLPAKNIVAISGSDNRDIRYELQSAVCRRIVKSPGETSPKLDTFTIGPAESWKLETAAPGRRPAYTITLEPSDSGKVTFRSAPFFVYAALGIDLP
jgi:type II secretory pathway pseudopilin PulG